MKQAKQHVRKVVIPAAGLGTRFLPATKAIPKEMLPIIDKPTIQYIVEEAVASGVEEILLVVSGSKNAIIDHFDYAYELDQRLVEKGKHQEAAELKRIADIVKITWVRQKEPLGLGHAILCAQDFVGNEPFGVMLGDDVVINTDGPPALWQCIDAYEKTGTTIVGVQPVPEDSIDRYGIVDPDVPSANKQMQIALTQSSAVLPLKDLVEKPKNEAAPSNLAIMGRYVLTPEIFAAITRTKPNARGEIELTDAIRMLQKKQGVHACWFTGRRFDIGAKFGLVEATIELALMHPDLADETTKLIRRLAKTIKPNKQVKTPAQAKDAKAKPRKS